MTEQFVVVFKPFDEMNLWITVPDMYWTSLGDASRFMRVLELNFSGKGFPDGIQSTKTGVNMLLGEIHYLDNFKSLTGNRQRAIDFLVANMESMLFNCFKIVKSTTSEVS